MPRMAWKTWKMSECASTRYRDSVLPAGMAARVRDSKHAPGQGADDGCRPIVAGGAPQTRERSRKLTGKGSEPARRQDEAREFGREQAGRPRRVPVQTGWRPRLIRVSHPDRVSGQPITRSPAERSGEGSGVERETGDVRCGQGT